MDDDVSQGNTNVPGSTELRRKQIFRSSCDSCASSKIKCDQDRPTCARCANPGIRCNYSPSRRMGKPPGKSRGLTKSSKTPQSKGQLRPLESPRQDFIHPTKEPAFNQDTSSLDTFLLDPDSLMSMQWQATSFAPASHSNDPK